jgi:hypothetical protein
MRGQKEMNILSDLRGQVHGFPSIKFSLDCKIGHFHLPLKGLQAGNARHADFLTQGSRGKKPTVGKPHIQGVAQGAEGFRPGILKSERGGILLPFQVQGFAGRNLSQMNLHGITLIENPRG